MVGSVLAPLEQASVQARSGISNRIDGPHRSNRLVGNEETAAQLTVRAQAFLLHAQGIGQGQPVQHEAVAHGLPYAVEYLLRPAADEAAVNTHLVQQGDDIAGKAEFVAAACRDYVGIKRRMQGEAADFARADGEGVVAQADFPVGQGRLQGGDFFRPAAHHQLGAMTQDQLASAAVGAKHGMDAQAAFLLDPRGEPEQFPVKGPTVIHGQAAAAQLELHIRYRIGVDRRGRGVIVI